MIFKDYFSDHAAVYAVARPHYPEELYRWLATRAPQHDLAWDCATGNGQAALGLAEHFQQVIATDASREQIESAFSHERVSYRVALAEAPGLEPRSVDLVTVAQAVHWFDRSKFYAEVKRVLKPSGVIAVWCYGLCAVTSDVDAVLQRFYHSEIGPYWPPERRLIDEDYRTIEFPFEEMMVPAFQMVQRWDLAGFMAYLRTWSAVQRCLRQSGRDPLEPFGIVLRNIWGTSQERKLVRWPLHVRAGRPPGR